jgi:CBS domain containing-hemolysin-like protein
VGALAAAQLGDQLREGAFFSFAGRQCEVIDMDGDRVDKVLVLP